MTKEEIREKHLQANGLSVNKTPVGKAVQKSAYDAMDEYAEQQVKNNSKALITFILDSLGVGHLYNDKMSIGDIVKAIKTSTQKNTD